MVIILEGPDGSGKSTTAQRIAQHFDLPTFHMGPPPEGISAKDQYLSVLLNTRTQYLGAVFDRFHLGERVYGPLVRGVDTLGDDGQRLVERALMQLGVTIIRCLPPYDVCYNNWSLRLALEYVKRDDMHRAIYDRYAAIESALPMLDFDYTSETTDSLIARMGVAP